MPRKFFKKYLPSNHSVRENRFLRIFGPLLRHHNLWHLHRRSVAGGVAVGLITGLIPGPVQIFSSAVFAIIFRVNLPVAILTTFYTNPFTFIPLYLLAYKVGSVFTGEQVTEVQAPELHLDWSDLTSIWPALVSWLSSMGHTLLIGLLIQCSVFALVGYFGVRGLWRLHVVRQWRHRHERYARRFAATTQPRPVRIDNALDNVTRQRRD